MLFPLLTTFLALLAVVQAAPVPAQAAKRFELVKGEVIPGVGFRPTLTVELDSQPTGIPEVEEGGSYFYLPSSLNLVSPPPPSPAKREVQIDNSAFVKRLTPFLLVRPSTGAVELPVEVAKAEREVETNDQAA